MTSMFSSASVFNQDMSGWNVGKVTAFGSMFANAAAFQADNTGWSGASSDPTTAVAMFCGAIAWLARHKRTATDGGGANDGPASARLGPGPFANGAALP